MTIKFGILTVSTTCSQHPEKDQAGPLLENEIREVFPDSRVTFRRIVTDDQVQIKQILEDVATETKCDVLFTVGGTGFSPSDVTPEATRAVIDKEATGLSYAIISKSLDKTDMAMLSRPACGIKNNTIIINFPGSSKAAVECFGFIKSVLPHAVALLREDKLQVKKDHRIGQQPELPSKVKIQAGASRLRQSRYPMLEVADALKLIVEVIPVYRESQEVAIEDSATRILAEDVQAPNPIPAFPASMKDGYAVRATDGAGHRTVRSVCAAGDAPEGLGLHIGEVVRISTGAPVPPGADAVVQVEDTALVEVSADGEEEKIVNIAVVPRVGQDIRQIGSDIEANAVVLQKHNEITAAYVGVLAMLGLSKVKVFRRPSVGIISTGNELVHFKDQLKPGLIHDSNKITLITLLKRYGYNAKDCGIARDNPNSVKAILERAFEVSDFVISSGGVSMGEYDLIKQVLVEDFDATIHFGRLNMKPGKPTVFATLNFKGNRKVIFSLPGNPVSCCVTSLLFVIPTLRHMEQNRAFDGWPIIKVILDHDISNDDSRPEYVRLRIGRNDTNQLTGRSTGRQISSRLNSMVDANGLLLVPGKSAFSKGHLVSVHLFDSLF